MSWSTRIRRKAVHEKPASVRNPGTGDSIVDGARQFFTTQTVGAIARHRGLSFSSVDRGITAALPGLLAALAETASRPKGMCELTHSLVRQYPATLGTIQSDIGSERQDVAAGYGSGYIEHLVGAAAFANVCTSIGRVSGLSDQESKLLAGLVGRIVMAICASSSDVSNLVPPDCHISCVAAMRASPDSGD
jgi:hypothetical protein